jgi:hypothetical protein
MTAPIPLLIVSAARRFRKAIGVAFLSSNTFEDIEMYFDPAKAGKIFAPYQYYVGLQGNGVCPQLVLNET